MYAQKINAHRYVIGFNGMINKDFLFEEIRADWALFIQETDSMDRMVGGVLFARFSQVQCNVLANRIDTMNTKLLRAGKPRIHVTSIDSREKPETDFLGNPIRENDPDAMLTYFIQSAHDHHIFVLGNEAKLLKNAEFYRAKAKAWESRANFWESKHDKQRDDAFYNKKLLEEQKTKTEEVVAEKTDAEKTLTTRISELEAELASEKTKPKNKQPDPEKEALRAKVAEFERFHEERKKALESKLYGTAPEVGGNNSFLALKEVEQKNNELEQVNQSRLEENTRLEMRLEQEQEKIAELEKQVAELKKRKAPAVVHRMEMPEVPPAPAPKYVRTSMVGWTGKAPVTAMNVTKDIFFPDSGSSGLDLSKCVLMSQFCSMAGHDDTKHVTAIGKHVKTAYILIHKRPPPVFKRKFQGRETKTNYYTMAEKPWIIELIKQYHREGVHEKFFQYLAKTYGTQ